MSADTKSLEERLAAYEAKAAKAREYERNYYLRQKETLAKHAAFYAKWYNKTIGNVTLK